MKKTIYQPIYWHYLTGNFLNRVHPLLRKALKILISVVVGSLLLAGLYMLFKDTLLPTLTERVVQLFNFSGYVLQYRLPP